jgi:drug/metabolite transporter (DMT)-like permease
MPSKHKPIMPVLALLLAATLWGVLWYPLRLLEQHGLQGLWTSLIIYAAALLVGGPLLRGRFAELRHHPRALLLILLFSGWTNIAFILAVLEGHVVRVLLLFYLSPLWAVILGWLILGERLTRVSLIALALAISGALLMLWAPELTGHWVFQHSDWYAVSSGLAFAATNVMVRKAHLVSVRVKSIIAWLGVVLLAAGWLMIGGASVPETGMAVLVMAFVLGAVGMVIMTYSVQYGVTHMPVQRSAVILLFELVAGAVSAQLLTDEAVLPREWLGGALIILASLISIRHGAHA